MRYSEMETVLGSQTNDEESLNWVVPIQENDEWYSEDKTS